jgi:hypothetical protein
MQMVQICEDFGWTYEQYLSQPQHFLTLIREKMRIDAKRKEQELNKTKRGY